jgi:hypothetical protein
MLRMKIETRYHQQKQPRSVSTDYIDHSPVPIALPGVEGCKQRIFIPHEQLYQRFLTNAIFLAHMMDPCHA